MQLVAVGHIAGAFAYGIAGVTGAVAVAIITVTAICAGAHRVRGQAVQRVIAVGLACIEGGNTVDVAVGIVQVLPLFAVDVVARGRAAAVVGFG